MPGANKTNQVRTVSAAETFRNYAGQLRTSTTTSATRHAARNPTRRNNRVDGFSGPAENATAYGQRNASNPLFRGASTHRQAQSLNAAGIALNQGSSAARQFERAASANRNQRATPAKNKRKKK